MLASYRYLTKDRGIAKDSHLQWTNIFHSSNARQECSGRLDDTLITSLQADLEVHVQNLGILTLRKTIFIAHQLRLLR